MPSSHLNPTSTPTPIPGHGYDNPRNWTQIDADAALAQHLSKQRPAHQTQIHNDAELARRLADQGPEIPAHVLADAELARRLQGQMDLEPDADADADRGRVAGPRYARAGPASGVGGPVADGGAGTTAPPARRPARAHGSSNPNPKIHSQAQPPLSRPRATAIEQLRQAQRLADPASRLQSQSQSQSGYADASSFAAGPSASTAASSSPTPRPTGTSKIPASKPGASTPASSTAVVVAAQSQSYFPSPSPSPAPSSSSHAPTTATSTTTNDPPPRHLCPVETEGADQQRAIATVRAFKGRGGVQDGGLQRLLHGFWPKVPGRPWAFEGVRDP